MKKLVYGALAITILTLSNCSSIKNDISNQDAKTKGKEETFTLDSVQSTLEWEGKWIGGQNDGKSHNGTVAITSGSVTQNGKVFNGQFIVDMNTIKCTDITNKESNANLIEDLESEYFFKIVEFPKVNVNITAHSKDSSSVTIEVLGTPITQTLPISISTIDKTMNITGSFYFDLEKANIPELFAHPKENKMGGISSKIHFNLNAKLDKE